MQANILIVVGQKLFLILDTYPSIRHSLITLKWFPYYRSFSTSPVTIRQITIKLLNKKSSCWWFEAPWCSCDVTAMNNNVTNQKWLGYKPILHIPSVLDRSTKSIADNLVEFMSEWLLNSWMCLHQYDATLHAMPVLIMVFLWVCSYSKVNY